MHWFYGACLLHAVVALAAPSVNVALEASFNASPYLVELLETAAAENSSSYFPLLDRIADGAFDHATTDKALYDLFLTILENEGHLASRDSLSSFKFALSIHVAAPRIEAHYQYYDTAVTTTIVDASNPAECDTWVSFNGRRYCSPELISSSGELLTDKPFKTLPFDRVLGDITHGLPTILYADPSSLDFRRFHSIVSKAASAGKSSYRLRYKRSVSDANKALAVSGYGVALSLKRTDYIVIDDRADDEQENAAADAKAKAAVAGKNDLRPLSASEVSDLGTKAVGYVMTAQKPLDALLDVSRDFPKHSAAIAAINVSQAVVDELESNLHFGRTSGLYAAMGINAIWINGLSIHARDFDAYALLEHLRRERALIAAGQDLGFTGLAAISLFSSAQLARSQDDSELSVQRYDWRDQLEGGNLIIWLNDIEKDKRYKDWPSSIRALLQMTYPGQLPSVQRDIHNVIVPTDFSSFDHVLTLIENVQPLIKRGIPIRWGIVPIAESPAASAQAEVVYHLLDTYGLGSLLAYLQKSLESDGRKHSSPSRRTFDQTVEGLKLRRNREVKSFDQASQGDSSATRIQSAQAYLRRLGLTEPAAPLMANGIAIARSEDWLQTLSGQVGTDLRIVQQAVYERRIEDDAYVPDLFLAEALPRRNALVIPEKDSELSFVTLNAVDGLRAGLIGSIPGMPADPATIESDMVHLVVVADFDHEAGEQLLRNAIAFRKEHDNVELYLVHNRADAEAVGEKAGDGGKLLSQQLHELLTHPDESRWTRLLDLNLPSAGNGASSERMAFWNSAKPLIDAAGLGAPFDQKSSTQPGLSGVLFNGRVVGPFFGTDTLDLEAFETLLSYERKKRLLPAAKVLKELGLDKSIKTPLAFAKLSSLLASSTASQGSGGIYGEQSSARTADFEQLGRDHTMIEVGDRESSTIQLVAAVDPASEQAQRYLPIIKVLSEMHGVHTRIYLNPKQQMRELPVKRFYRHILQSAPTFAADGSLEVVKAEFGNLPESALLTLAMDVPPAWLVSPRDSVHDLDNLKLSNIKSGNVEATYQLDYILIEGHSRDATQGQPPRGAQLVLGTDKDPHFADTIIMANLGYFQFKTNPGYYHLSLQKGRSDEIFNIDTIGGAGRGGSKATVDNETDIALISFRGTTLYPRLSRKVGMEEEDVLQASTSSGLNNLANKAEEVLSGIGLDAAGHWLSKASKVGNSLLGKMDGGKRKDVSGLPHAEINIFSVASGHLYERMLNIMMLSVTKHTTHTVKFWFIEQFLSPSFKAFLPIISEEYGFRYEMVTYKWPHWLRDQREKQREIWGYKILFLDVLFPLDLDKVIFVDADQIVRTDMYELVQHDLQGAPYGFTPMCDSRTEMEGFRFWKQGYWKNFLRGLPYHISALYVVDLRKFRQMAAGDRLRGQYHQLSADPNSLSNLDQDLPNHMQHNLPIHSLPQEWLWCETWCSDESQEVAKTIDLCNNPQTKEPKLDRARRQVPEWTVYDDEIAALAKRKADAAGDSAAPIAGSVLRDSDAQAQVQAEEAAQHKRTQEQDTSAVDQGEPQQETRPEHVIDEL